MAFTYDVATSRGRVRLLITDTDGDHAIFTDAEVDAFLALESSSVKRAAATALDQIASSEALVQKRIKLLDLSTDGPSVAKALREHAALLRTQADAEEATEDGGSFDWAEMVVNDFTARERIWNEALRG
jgi:hypothetical protein